MGYALQRFRQNLKVILYIWPQSEWNNGLGIKILNSTKPAEHYT